MTIEGFAMSLNIRRQEAPNWLHATIALYGAPGVGKTRLAAQAPAPLIIDVEGGCGALVGDIASISAPDELSELVSYLTCGQHPYQSVILDGLDTLYALYLKSAKGYRGEPRSFHADAQNRLEGLLREFVRLPVLKVVTGHAKTETETIEDDSQRVMCSTIHIDLAPAMRETFAGLCDVVAYCFIGTKGAARGKRLLLAQPAISESKGKIKHVFAKDRTGNLGDRPMPLAWETLARGLALDGR